MKRTLICLVAVCALIFTSCKKNPAEDFEGTYVMTYTVEATGTVAGQTQTVNTDPATAAVTISLDGDEGDVIVKIVNTDGTTLVSGNVDDAGLHMDSYNYRTTVSGFDVDVLVTNPTIAVPTDKIMTWNSTIAGNASITLMGVPISTPITGTMKCTAVKQ